MTNYSDILTLDNLLSAFPSQQYPTILPNQQTAFEALSGAGGSLVLEMPTGSGKTGVGYTLLKALSPAADAPLFYVVPNKTLVDQVLEMHPDLVPAYGRNEYDCLYYVPEIFKADEIPCLSLNCPHRVDQETGETAEEGALPCPYYLAKYRAKRSKIVVCTTAFYLFTQLFSKEFERPAGLVLDEVHQIANSFRSLLSYDISDWHLDQAIKVLRKIGADEEADSLFAFKSVMIGVLRGKSPDQPTLLKDEEITMLMKVLKGVDGNKLRRRVVQAIQAGEIDPLKDRLLLKQLETITYDLYRYVHSFEYALPGEKRHPLNYVTYAYSVNEPDRQKRVQYKLVIRAYYVGALVRKLLAPMTLAYSATVGDADVFKFETGIEAPVVRLSSAFSPENTRVFMPTDTPDLAATKRIKQEPTKSLRKVTRACHRFAENDIRSLVVVVSEKERQKFLWLCEDEGVDALSYGDGVTPRQAASLFKEGQGSVLVGTAANYGEGVDLPDGMSPVIFFLRPGYPNPKHPSTQFEERRYGNRRWPVWSWRVMIQALQVRGRNVRSVSDRGVTIFVSQQFRRFLFSSLPNWLKPSYEGGKTFDECIEETLEMLSRETV